MSIESYPIEKVREEFPALQRIENGHFVGYFDGPGGTQVAKTVIDAMAAYMKNGIANLGGVYPTSRETAVLVDEAREYTAIFLGANKSNIIFGANTTTLVFRIARAISRSWEQGKGNIVVTEMDHHANIDPWITAANDKEMSVNTIKVDEKGKSLQLDQINSIINDETKLVAVGLASNAIGTINDIAQIIKRAKEVGALVSLDAVHAVPHFNININGLSADFVFCSAYKFFGPHVGICVVKESTFEEISPYKLVPAPDSPPDSLETGTVNFEGLIGLTEAIRFIASLGEGNLLQEQLISAYEKMGEYEDYLANRLREGLATIDFVQLFQADDSIKKTPTVAFTVKGMSSKMVCHYLAQNYALHLEFGDFYATTLVNRLNPGEDGLVRAGIAPYNTIEEVERLITAVKEL